MKNNPILTILLGTFIVLSNCMLYAQNTTITEIQPSDMTVCMGDYTFQLKIKNNTSTNMTAMNVELTLPEFINYTGNLTNANEILQTNPNQVTFEITQIQANDSILISYSAEASCEIIQNIINNTTIQNNYEVNYLLNTNLISETSTQQSYNLLYPSLVMTSNTSDSILTVGEHLSPNNSNSFREIGITNVGNGSTDRVIVRITPENEIQYQSFIAFFNGGNLNFTPDGNDLIIDLFGVELQNASDQSGPNPFLFEPGEIIRIMEDFKVSACSTNPNQNTNYQLEWGCLTNLCLENTISKSSNINVLSGNANIISAVLEGSQPKNMANYCGLDTTFTFLFINSSSISDQNFASNIVLDIISTEEFINFPTNFELSNFKINGVDLSPEPIFSASTTLTWPHTLDNIPDGNTDNYTNANGFIIDLSANTNVNLGVEDLDGDQLYDDLYPGDTIKVTCKFKFIENNAFYEQNSLQFNSIFAIPQAKWDNNCGFMKRGSSGKSSKNQYIASFSGGSTTDISEPIDFMQDSIEIFRFCTGNFEQDLSFFNCPIDSHYALIHVPEGYELALGILPQFQDVALWIPANNSPFQADTVSLAAEQIGTDIFIYGGGKDKFWTGCYELPLVLNCNLAPNGIAAITTIDWELRYLCDTCSIEQKRVSSSQNVYNHVNCSVGNSCSGIVSESLELKRSSFGWTDISMTQKVNENTPNINLKAAYPFDTVSAVISGRISDLNFTRGFAELSYTFSDATAYFSVLNGVFEVYDSAGNNTGNIYQGIDTSTIISNQHIIKFEIPSACLNQLNVGDSITLEVNLLVNLSAHVFANDFIEIPDLRSQFSSITDGFLQTCENWGDRFFLYSTETKVRVKAEPNGCNDTKISLSTLHYGGILGDDFPNEFRPIIKMNNPLIFTIPDGYSYNGVAGTSYHFNADGPNYSINHTDEVVPVQLGNNLIFSHNWPLLDKGGHNNLQYTPPIFDFYLTPSCDRNDTIISTFKYNYDEYFYTSDSSHFVNWDWNEGSGINSYFTSGSDTFNINVTNYQPNITTLLLNSSKQIAYSQTLTWDAYICNLPGDNQPIVGNASNVWFNIDQPNSNVGNIQIDKVALLNPFTEIPTTTYNNDSSTFVKLGDLLANECKTYRIYVSYSNCNDTITDTLKLSTAWSCEDDLNPIDAEIYSCNIHSNNLKITYTTADLQLASTSLPQGNHGLCDILHYEFQLTSAGQGNMADVDFWLNLPDGAQVVNPNYSYPNNNSWQAFQTSTSNFSGYNAIGWQLDSLVFFGSNYEFMGNGQSASNNLWISFDIVMDCNFNSSQEMIVNAKGTTNCKEDIQLNAGYFITIAENQNMVHYELKHTLTDTLICKNENGLSFTVKNIGENTNQIGDSLKIYLPEGFEVIVESLVSNQARLTDNQLIFPIEVLPSNNSQTFSFNLHSKPNPNCSELIFVSEIMKQIVSSCALSCIDMAIIDTIKTVYCCNTCNLNADFLTDTVCVKNEMCFTLADHILTSNPYNHYWDFGDGYSSDKIEPCHKYSSEGSYSITHIIMNDLGCSDTITLQGIVKPCPEIVVKPNPTVNQQTVIYFSSDDRGAQRTKIEVFNMWGDIVKVYETNSEVQEFNLDLKYFAQGIYFVRLSSDNELIKNEKVLVVN